MTLLGAAQQEKELDVKSYVCTALDVVNQGRI